jgi:hypothetical protein
MKQILFVYWVALLTTNVYAQASRLNVSTIQDLIDPGMANPDLLYNKTESIQGTVYFEKEWLPGTVIDKGGKVYEGVTLSYHNYQDNLYIKNGEKVAMVNKNLVDKFTILVGTQRYLFVSVPLASRDVYAEPLYNGKTKLLKHYQKIIERKGNNYNEQFFQAYVDKPMLLIQLEGQKAIEFKMNKKFILATFPDKASALEGYWKKEKNKFKTENDVVNTLKFLDSIAN